MLKTVTVCIGTKAEPHEPIVMKVDKNGVDIFRTRIQTHPYEKGDIVLTEGEGWKELAAKMGVTDFGALEHRLMMIGGDYYGSSDRYVCTFCGSTICWREY